MMKSSPLWVGAFTLGCIQVTGLASAATAPAGRATGSLVQSPMGVTTGQREPWRDDGPMEAMRDTPRATRKALWRRGASAGHCQKGHTLMHLS